MYFSLILAVYTNNVEKLAQKVFWGSGSVLILWFRVCLSYRDGHTNASIVQWNWLQCLLTCWHYRTAHAQTENKRVLAFFMKTVQMVSFSFYLQNNAHFVKRISSRVFPTILSTLINQTVAVWTVHPARRLRWCGTIRERATSYTDTNTKLKYRYTRMLFGWPVRLLLLLGHRGRLVTFQIIIFK